MTGLCLHAGLQGSPQSEEWDHSHPLEEQQEEETVPPGAAEGVSGSLVSRDTLGPRAGPDCPLWDTCWGKLTLSVMCSSLVVPLSTPPFYVYRSSIICLLAKKTDSSESP